MSTSAIGTLLDGLDWQPVDGSGPPPQGLHATHHGLLEIAGASFRCYRLNDGRAVIHQDDLMAFLAGGLNPQKAA